MITRENYSVFTKEENMFKDKTFKGKFDNVELYFIYVKRSHGWVFNKLLIFTTLDRNSLGGD